MLIRPIATEKAYHEQTKRGYMFVVPNDASKQAVAKQVSEQFNVTVTSVRISVRKGVSACAKVKQLASAVVSMPILVQLIVKTRKLLLLLLKRATKSRSLTRSQ